MAYASARRLGRAEQRARMNARVAQPIPATLRAQDPLRHGSKAGAAFATLVIAGALIAHVLVIGSLWAAGGLIRALSDKIPDPRDKTIELTVILGLRV